MKHSITSDDGSPSLIRKLYHEDSFKSIYSILETFVLNGNTEEKNKMQKVNSERKERKRQSEKYDNFDITQHRQKLILANFNSTCPRNLKNNLIYKKQDKERFTNELKNSARERVSMNSQPNGWYIKSGEKKTLTVEQNPLWNAVKVNNHSDPNSKNKIKYGPKRYQYQEVITNEELHIKDRARKDIDCKRLQLKQPTPIEVPQQMVKIPVYKKNRSNSRFCNPDKQINVRDIKTIKKNNSFEEESSTKLLVYNQYLDFKNI